AALDLDLAIPDRADDPAGGVDGQAVLDGDLAFEAAADLRRIDLDVALEEAGFGNLDRAAVGQYGLDPALDHEAVAGPDLAGQEDSPADDQLLGVDVGRARRARLGAGLGPARRRCTDIGQPARRIGKRSAGGAGEQLRPGRVGARRWQVCGGVAAGAVVLA